MREPGVADYKRQWGVYRRWSNLGFALLVGYVVAMAMVIVATEGHPKMGWVPFFLFAAFAAAFVSVAVKAGTFPCPRCGQQFHAEFWNRFGVTWKGGDKCVHCGLAKYADG
jgi:hypothetical protein